MGSDCSRLGKSYDQIYLPADCFRQCHAGDRCFCGSRHRSRKWMYVERGGDGREYFHDPMNYMDGFMMGGAGGGTGGSDGNVGGGCGAGSLFPPGIMQSPDNWRLKDFERLNQVLLEYWNRLRGQQMVMAPYLGGGGGVGRPGSLIPSWMMGSPGMNFGDVMGANCGLRMNPLRRGGRFGGGDYGSWEDEMMQRMKRMEEIAKDYEDRVRGVSDHLYGSSAERQEEMYRKRQQQMWQDFMQGQQTQNVMGMNGLGGMGGGMNGLAQMMPMQGLAGGMNPMMAGMGGLGGLMNPLQMGALGGLGANPLMGGAGLGAGSGAEDDRLSRRRRLGSRRRNSMFQDDDDDDDDILPRRRFGRRRRGGFRDDDDDLLPGRFGEEDGEEEEEEAEDVGRHAVHTVPTVLSATEAE
ncbi:hypothetical protein KC340_g18440 [Hortaea werneckii]|nr:hypothetical protein KC342_g8589 [Hortaea werneckii]KAI7096283.1 hypothetical protein KC339_g10486 [Hortaea werneckii]KAI7220351.1 hypothetical protein KC365_g12032 [Hortaea werneckii]KAI7284630.1 hypothetical protein KC340_g18440 [Hortaea werneckii]KAI7379439.1 hypothetical protein KC328_g13333 [Hortaea werneckii]